MINKLRKKIITLTSISVFALLILILGTINFVNFSIVTNDADEITKILEDNHGTFEKDRPPLNQKYEPPGIIPSKPSDSPETSFTTRYFTFAFDKDENEQEIAFNISEETYSKQDCINWAKSLINAKKGWSKTIYRYRVYSYNNLTYVSIIDQGRELRPSFNILLASIIGSFIGLIITFIVSLLISKKLVRPILESDTKQKRFISDASIALKTPTTIIGIDNDALKEKYGNNEYLTSIEREVNKLDDLVKDLNSLLLFEEKPVEVEQVNVSRILYDLVDDYKDAFKTNKKELNLDIKEDLIGNVDREMIYKMLNEIIENQLKYSLSTASIKLDGDENRITFEFINDASNIKDGDLDMVFNRFYKLENNSTNKGNGIGLSLVNLVVNRHNGRVKARGENGEFILKIEL